MDMILQGAEPYLQGYLVGLSQDGIMLHLC